MAKTVIYNADGSVFSSVDTAGTGLVYNRVDIGILLLNQVYSTSGVYDFRVPGDSNNNTFKYRFPRAGVVLGVSVTGTVNTTLFGGFYVTRYNAATTVTSDMMTPADAGNTQSYDTTTFPQKGALIMAANPIAYNKDDLAAMKFSADRACTVSLAGFLLVGLSPQ